MYNVETHNNSKEYFNRLLITRDSFHVTSNTALSNMIKERARCLEEDKWRVLDIENLINTLYKDWNTTLNGIKVKAEVRKILVDLKNEIEDEKDIKELKYFEDNFNILTSDINLLAQTNINYLSYSTHSRTKRLLGLIYNRLITTTTFKELSHEILNPIEAREFYKKLKNYKENETVEKIYFYNINYLDLKRYLVIELLRVAGFQIIFRIPYFKSLEVVNKCWDMVYGDNSIFNSFQIEDNDININSKYISFLKGEPNVKNMDEKVISKTYKEVGDFLRDLVRRNLVRNDLDSKKIITFYKGSLAACMNRDKLAEEHCFQTTIGRFLFNLYTLESSEDDVKMNFQLYRELITSGWIEYKSWNGIRLSEYLMKNEDYFNGVKTINEIIERINKLRDLEEVNGIFEGQVKQRIKGDEQKKFLSNPFRAFGYNNTERFNITSNYMLEVTLRLKRFIIKAMSSENGLIDINEHFELLKIAFRNNYVLQCNKVGADIQKLTIKKIWGVLNNAGTFGDKLHKSELKDLFTITLKIGDDESNKGEEVDFSIDQLEGIILRDWLTKDGDRQVIYISDMSFKSYEKYISNKYISGKILNDIDLEDIFSSSLKGSRKQYVKKGLELEKQSIKATHSYVKFAFANLFINFSGEKEFSWIEGLREDDSKSIILKQIEAIYDLKSEVKEQGLDFEDMIDENDIRIDSPNCDIKELIKDYVKYSDVTYRDLDFCSMKFLYSSVLNSYPTYYSDFHQKLVFSGIISIMKNSMENSYKNIASYIFPLFPQWEQVIKSNILTCEYARKNIRDYKFFEGINYPKNIDSMYLLKSKYVVGENWKIKSRYNKETFKAENYYKEFLQEFLSCNGCYKGMHCSMCPHIYLCRKGEFIIDNK